jgi:hypothetical protein
MEKVEGSDPRFLEESCTNIEHPKTLIGKFAV